MRSLMRAVCIGLLLSYANPVLLSAGVSGDIFCTGESGVNEFCINSAANLAPPSGEIQMVGSLHTTENLSSAGVLNSTGALTVNGSATLGDAAADALTINGSTIVVSATYEVKVATKAGSLSGGATPLISFDGANQRIGVGGSAPSSRLHVVSGTAQFDDSAKVGSNAADAMTLHVSTIIIPATYSVVVQTSIYTNGVTNVMTLDGTNKRVGIGGSSPSAALHVIAGTAQFDDSVVLGATSADAITGNGALTQAANASFTADSTFGDAMGDKMTLNIGTAVINATYGLTVATGPGQSTALIRVIPSYVGIGTVAPDTLLHVAGAAKVTGAATLQSTLSVSDVITATGAVHLGPVIISTSTLTPGTGQAMLHIYGAANTSETGILINNYDKGDTLTDGIRLYIDANGDAVLNTQDATNIRIKNANGEKMTVVATGLVGIGNTSPTESLHVANAGSTSGVVVSTSAASPYQMCLAAPVWTLPSSGFTEGCLIMNLTDHKIYVSTEAVDDTGSWVALH